ncbi:MAG TPA: CPBP family intramembrane glutamic endopeptidase [Anaerolineales bacterium]|nr:CPBP family intramembrane glutamic endopeptidase [Anaerolineales bacterium]
MNQTFIKRHSLVIGILLMFLLTWPIDLANAGILPIQVPFVLYLFLGWGFGVAAVIMTGLTLGKTAVISLLKRYFQWRVGWKWYLAPFVLAPALIVGGVYLNAALTGVAPDFSSVMAYKIFGQSAYPPFFILPFLLTDLLANGEEIGWRGYVLPRLQAKHSALTSTLMLGVIWGFWHLPKFLTHWDTVSFAWFMLHTLAAAVLYTWLYNGTKGSLMLTALFHAASNTTGVFMPMANTVSSTGMGAYIAYVLLEVAAAIIIVIVMGPQRLSRTEAMQVQAAQ